MTILFFIFLFFIFVFIYDSHTEREREAETQAEGEAGSMHREPDVGFDPGSPGSRPGPKAGAKPAEPPRDPPSLFFKPCISSVQRGLAIGSVGVHLLSWMRWEILQVIWGDCLESRAGI